MKVIQFIKEHGLGALTRDFGIKVRELPTKNLIGLNYDQIESPKTHPIVMECRSLVLNYNYEVVARAFPRFFNYGEAPDTYADLDISRAVVLEKADGSLIKIYFNPFTSQWEISTRSSPDGDVPFVSGGTFRERVLKTLGWSEGEFQMHANFLSKEYTWVFEYIGPENRIVTRYETSELVLTGLFDNKSGKCLDLSCLKSVGSALKETGWNVRLPEIHKLDSFDHIAQASKDLPTLAEGYVVWDPVSGQRCKIKNPAYVAIHHLRENGALSQKRIFELVLMNEHEEYLTYYPEDRHAFEPAIAAVEITKADMISRWDCVCDIEDQKEFALAVKDWKYSWVFFTAKKLKKDPIVVFDESDASKKLRLFVE